MAAHPGPKKKKVLIPAEEDPIIRDVPKSRKPEANFGVSPATATGRAVRSLLTETPGGVSEKEEQFGKEGAQTRIKEVLTPTEATRRRSVQSLRSGGPRDVGPSGAGFNPDTGLTEAVGATQSSGRTRGSVKSGGAAGGGTGGGTPTFAVEGNFRSGVLNTGLFSDTTGLSAIDKLNPRR